MTFVVKSAFMHHSDEGGIIHVRAGSPTEAIPDQKRLRLLSPDAFEPGTPERAYAEEYGILIGLDNLRYKAATEVDTYLAWTIHEDQDGAWAVRDNPHRHVTAPRVSALYELIDDAEED